ncbi:hypothetical protein MUK42_30019 [Musa troglodytarum]|uniref:Uncharacterized protein n=1 Tax=Musa troglodytarum TaxID=320322 RepID=A0A9E7FHZ2_9LILI|nr:hypothetical protein MUK42_30019 [Musa troglodytarum]
MTVETTTSRAIVGIAWLMVGGRDENPCKKPLPLVKELPIVLSFTKLSSKRWYRVDRLLNPDPIQIRWYQSNNHVEGDHKTYL